MKTTCLECGKEFELDYMNVYNGHEHQIPHNECVVIVCPHCKKRKEL